MLWSTKFQPFQQFTIKLRYMTCRRSPKKLQHLICFKQWTADMVMDIIISAINLKRSCRDTQCKTLNTLSCAKVMILQELNEPILSMAVCKAASFLGANGTIVRDQMIWHHDYNGCIFSKMADVIFVSTTTHMCIQRFANMSSVPVICMRSRTHASIQSLATIMAIMEEFGSMKCVNVAWLGPPHPILNSYLLLCPMLGANIKFKCCCSKCPISPLLFKAGKDLVAKTGTTLSECTCKGDVLEDAHVVISGPEVSKKQKLPEFQLSPDELDKHLRNWIYFHTCPRGDEVDDQLFYHCRSRTFVAMENMQYIAAALMANAVIGYKF